MLRAHHIAARQRLEAHPLLAGTISDAVRTDQGPGASPVRDNYVVLNTTLPLFAGARLAGAQALTADQLVELYVRVVAVDLTGLQLLMDAVNEQLLGHRLVVAGRALTPLERTEFDQPDYDFDARVHFQDAVFEATSSRPV